MKINKLALSMLLILSLTYGCKKIGTQSSDPALDKLSSLKSDDLISKIDLGKKLNNPYSVANMKQALANLTADGDIKQLENAIKATHYYIKFIPRDDKDFSLLKVDSNLLIYPFPLDVELNKYSNSFRDPSVAKGVPTYQYASVPVNYKLPNVPYEKLAELYLPDEQKPKSKISIRTTEKIVDVTVENTVNEALRIALPPEGENDGSSGPEEELNDPQSDYWHPNGRITVYDEVLGATIGVEGLKVRARRWFTTYIGITNSNGYFVVDGTFSRAANYWFEFERYDFSVNDENGGPQEVEGPKQKASWNVNLDGFNKMCATIFRAAFHYYYGDIQGLRRPPQNSTLGWQVKIGAFRHYDVNNTSLARVTIGEPMIDIFTNTNDQIDDTYATTIHELAHAVHWNMYSSNPWLDPITTYTATSLKVCESWARGVQWSLTKMVYPNYKGGIPHENYTNVVVDMIDTSSEVSYPTFGFTSWGMSSPDDEVTGYSILEVQDALHGQTSWIGWKNNIKSLYSNGTEQNLDALFDAWYY